MRAAFRKVFLIRLVIRYSALLYANFAFKFEKNQQLNNPASLNEFTFDSIQIVTVSIQPFESIQVVTVLIQKTTLYLLSPP